MAIKDSNKGRFSSWAELWGHIKSHTLCGIKRPEVRINVHICAGANDWVGQLGTCRKWIEISRKKEPEGEVCGRVYGSGQKVRNLCIACQCPLTESSHHGGDIKQPGDRMAWSIDVSQPLSLQASC